MGALGVASIWFPQILGNGRDVSQLAFNGQVAPAQLDEAQLATHAKVIIVSVGADDVEWSIMTRLCAASAVCNDKVSAAYFSEQIGAFTRSYYQLLADLVTLPGTPAVLVNQYYSPFGTDIGCLSQTVRRQDQDSQPTPTPMRMTAPSRNR